MFGVKQCSYVIQDSFDEEDDFFYTAGLADCVFIAAVNIPKVIVGHFCEHCFAQTGNAPSHHVSYWDSFAGKFKQFVGDDSEIFALTLFNRNAESRRKLEKNLLIGSGPTTRFLRAKGVFPNTTSSWHPGKRHEDSEKFLYGFMCTGYRNLIEDWPSK